MIELFPEMGKSKKKKAKNKKLAKACKNQKVVTNETNSSSVSTCSSSESELSIEIIPETPLNLQGNIHNQASEQLQIDTPSLPTLSSINNFQGDEPLASSSCSAKNFSSQVSESDYVNNISFPTLPSQSPLIPTPPSTLYSGTQNFLMHDQNNNQRRAAKRILNTSNCSLFNDEEDEVFHGFTRKKKNKLTNNSDIDQYMDDDNISSSVHLQLSSSQRNSSRDSTGPNNAHSSNYHSVEELTVPETERRNPPLTPNQRYQPEQSQPSVIIIQPNEESRTPFFSSKMKLFRLLQNSPFQSANIISSRTNVTKGIQIISFLNKNKTDDLLKITKLGDYEVTCYQPDSFSKSKVGIIGPIELDVKEEEIVELLMDIGYENPKAKRLVLGKGNNIKITKTMKIWLNVDKLPEDIPIMYRLYKVTPFVDRAWQCYKCQQFGHFASNCANQNVCVLCSGQHNVKECPNKNENAKKCHNCGGSHTANYGGCVKMQQEKKVQHIRAHQGISYRDAVKAINTANISNGTNQINRNTKNQGQTVKKTRDITDPPMKSIAIQTTENKSTSTEEVPPQAPLQSVQTTNQNEKLALCLLDLFISVMKNDSIPKKCNIISKAFETHLGVNISKDILLSSVKNMNNKPTASPIIQTKSTHSRNVQPKS